MRYAAFYIGDARGEKTLLQRLDAAARRCGIQVQSFHSAEDCLKSTRRDFAKSEGPLLLIARDTGQDGVAELRHLHTHFTDAHLLFLSRESQNACSASIEPHSLFGLQWSAIDLSQSHAGQRLEALFGRLIQKKRFRTTIASASRQLQLAQPLDISRQKRRLFAEQHAATIVRLMVDSLIVTNGDGIIEFVNEATVALLEYPEDELIGRPVGDILAEEEEEEEEEAFLKGTQLQRLLQQGFVRDVRIHYQSKSGEMIPVDYSGTVIREEHGALLGIVGVAKDCRGQIKQQKLFHMALEASPNGMVMINEAGEITLVNKQTEVQFGYTRDELLGKRIELLVPERIRAAHLGHRTEFLRAPVARAMGATRDLFGLTKSGQEIPVEIGLNPVAIDGETFVLAAIVDITERKKLERELLAQCEASVAAEHEQIRLIALEDAQVAALNMMKDLEEGQRAVEAREQRLKDTQQMLVQAGKLAAMGQLGAGIAHELNQPLAAIRGYSQVLMEEIAAEDPHRKDLEKIVSMTTRMGLIIDNVRAFSRDTKTDNKELVDIHKTIDDALMLVNEQLKHRSIEVIREFGKDLPKVPGNANQLQQVFINLSTNARDALDESGQGSGKIWIKTETKDQRLKTKDQKEGSMVNSLRSIVVSFRNDGPPIPSDVIDRIFDPFFTTKEVGKGTGLGLSISYGIIKDHGGAIVVENLTEGGVAFRISLPAA